MSFSQSSNFYNITGIMPPPPPCVLAGTPLVRGGGVPQASTSRGGGGNNYHPTYHQQGPPQQPQPQHHHHHHHHPHNLTPKALASIAAAKEQRLKEHREKRRQQIQSRFKTEMCKSFLQGVACQFGETCSYAHCLEELRVEEVNPNINDANIGSPLPRDNYTPQPTTSINNNITLSQHPSTALTLNDDDVSSTCESYECHYGSSGDDEDDSKKSTPYDSCPPPSAYSYKPFIQHPMMYTSSPSSSSQHQYQQYYSGGSSNGATRLPHNCCGCEESVDECGITFEGMSGSTAVLSCYGEGGTVGLRSPEPPHHHQSRKYYTHNPYARF